MSWFNRYMEKWSWDDFSDEEKGDLGNLEPRWMERLTNGQFYWQVSLDKIMQRGRKQWGRLWNESANKPGPDRNDVKKMVFFAWAHRVPDDVLFKARPQIDAYMEQTEGFRPFESENDAEDTSDVQPWSTEEFVEWMG